MFELLPLAETAQLPIDQLDTADPLRTTFDGVLTIGAVMAVYRLGRRTLMGYFLPPDTDASDLEAATPERDPYALALMAVLYATGTGLTTYSVYLGTTLSLALAWGGVCTFLGSALAFTAYRDALPIDDVRLLVAATGHER